MRFLIPFLCLIMFVACHNKSDLKKIAELQDEIMNLKCVIDSNFSNRAYRIDTIIKERIDLGDGFYPFQPINNSERDFIQV